MGKVMDFRKLDSGLVTFCSGAEDQPSTLLEVFVQTTQPPTDEQITLLENVGVRNVSPGRRVFTARLRLEDVAQLTEQSWVKTITSAQQLFPARLA